MNPMSCEDTIERLPWLLNGSLEAEERAALLLHLQGCSSCREALGETRLAFDIFSRHLSAEQLVALAADETLEPTDSADLEVLYRHLETCAQCAADLELARMSRQLVSEDKVALMPAVAASRRKTAGRAAWWPAALAAGLTALVLGGGWFTSSQKLTHQLAEQRAEAGAIESNGEMVVLSAPSVARGEGEAAQKVLPAGKPILVMIELRRGGPEVEQLALKIFDARDDLVLAPRDLLQRTAAGDYRFLLGKNALPPGPYTVRAYREGDGTALAEYPIRIGP